MATDTIRAISFLNNTPIIDKADGEHINHTPSNDNINILPGVGRSAAVLNGNRATVVTLTVLPDSPINMLLNSLYEAQLATPGGRSIFNYVYTEVGSLDMVVATEAYIANQPAIISSTTGANTIWTLHLPNPQVYTKGGRPIP